MELVSTVWQLFGIVAVWFFGACIVIKASRALRLGWRRSMVLYVWHTVFSFFYANYVIASGGDAIDYYQASLLPDIDFSIGTSAVVVFVRIFSYYFGFSFFGVFLVFNIFGAIGLMSVDASLRHAALNKRKFVRKISGLIVFLPSMSFWSSAIGKDAVSFMSMGLMLWSALDFGRRLPLVFLSVFIMFLVRPHIAVLMLVGIGASIILRRGVSFPKRFLLVSIAGVVAIFLVPFALRYAGLGDANGVEDLGEYIQGRQSYNQDGGGGVDIASMSLPMQLFTFFFRPLPFEANSVFSLAAALDNVVLMFVCLVGSVNAIKSRGAKKFVPNENRVFLWVYSLLAWLVLAVTTANLGISIRQKWMFAPILIFLFISLMMEKKKRNNRVMSIPAASDASLLKL